MLEIKNKKRVFTNFSDLRSVVTGYDNTGITEQHVRSATKASILEQATKDTERTIDRTGGGSDFNVTTSNT